MPARFAYVTSASGMQILNISDPARPAPVGKVATLMPADKVALSGQYAYIAEHPSWDSDLDLLVPSVLQIAYVGDPSRPAALHGYPRLEAIKDVQVSGTFAYLAQAGRRRIHMHKRDGMEGIVDSHFFEDPGLFALDISDPERPVGIGGCKLGDVHRLLVSGSYGYAALGTGSVYVVKVADPRRPKLVSKIIGAGYIPKAMALVGCTLLVLAEGGLYTCDVTKPSRDGWFSRHELDGFGDDMAVSGSHAYLALEHFPPSRRSGALLIVDVSDAPHPRPAATWEHSLPLHVVATDGSYAYVADTSALHIIDVRRPHELVAVAVYATPELVTSVALA